MDLIAINMQRGRDHGLQGYVQYRRACRAGPSDSFDDFSNNMTPEVKQTILQHIFQRKNQCRHVMYGKVWKSI